MSVPLSWPDSENEVGSVTHNFLTDTYFVDSK